MRSMLVGVVILAANAKPNLSESASQKYPAKALAFDDYLGGMGLGWVGRPASILQNNLQRLDLILFCFAIQYTTCQHSCPRDRTRLVRNILKEKVYPLYQETKTQMPEKCPFSPERDKYLIQEEHKVMEYMSKWYCNFCGKGFYTEMHLDLHFDNRHPEYTRQDASSICYADYCDIMRCDVLAGNLHPDFWEVSLCLEEDMKDLANDCEKYLSDCLPAGATKNSTEYITMKLYDGICSYLTCKKYWETPVKKYNTILSGHSLHIDIIDMFIDVHIIDLRAD
ncbi:hypothetical protein FSP39_018476 [Pinctada imbricata]|uniref:C2H2-type domain-containing protein n=1 Tax=Pinctada imbricata TaxID=66713 RepID=A0AA89C2A5_PINIB|nr:hypothetical protein FSP39_018476 [Pinctada imbricata]